MRKRLKRIVESAVRIFPASSAAIASDDSDGSHVWCLEAFRSKILPGARDLWIYVPPGYGRDSRVRYPVLYLHDGQNLFVDEAATSGHSWKVQAAADQAIESGEAAPLIIVGIPTPEHRRIREYTPTPDRKHPDGGGAESYMRFVITEVKPRIDTLFRTGSDRLRTAIGGSSLGGLVSMWAALRWPGVFSRVAAMSPSVWWDAQMIVRTVEALTPHPDLRIWIDIGSAEGRTAIEGARALHRSLVAKGWSDGVDLAYREIERGEHDELAWGSRLADVLKFLFPAQR